MAYNTGSVLFVDDDEVIAALLPALLELEGYEVTVSTSSINALGTFRRDPQHFDLVITDYVMPEMTGDVLIGHLRRLRPDIPIILCSGFYKDLDMGHIQVLEVDAFLPKPVTFEDLSQAIQDALHQRAEQDTSTNPTPDA